MLDTDSSSIGRYTTKIACMSLILVSNDSEKDACTDKVRSVCLCMHFIGGGNGCVWKGGGGGCCLTCLTNWVGDEDSVQGACV